MSVTMAEYTADFVNQVLKAALSDQELTPCDLVDLTVCEDTECLAGDIERVPDTLAVPEDRTRIKQAIKRLHANLGHPSVKDLVRVLQHSKASPQAIEKAKQFTCTICSNSQTPHAALPAKTGRVTEFNAKVGIDIKCLPGWKTNQRVPCVSMVDYASSLHIVAPIFRREDAEILGCFAGLMGGMGRTTQGDRARSKQA